MRILVLIAAFLLSSTNSGLADSDVSVVQSSRTNFAHFVQSQNTNRYDLIQSGRRNIARGTQTGTNNVSNIVQNGANNSAEVTAITAAPSPANGQSVDIQPFRTRKIQRFSVNEDGSRTYFLRYKDRNFDLSSVTDSAPVFSNLGRRSR